MYHHVFNKRALKITPLLVIILMLGGCLVDSSSDSGQVIYRTTDVIKPIVNGDFYEYRLVGTLTSSSGTGSSTIASGTLRVEYYVDNSFTLPFSTDTYPETVFREETDLTFANQVHSTIRYIQQNADGSLQVLATQVGGEIFRAGLANDDINVASLGPILYLESPVPTTNDLTADLQYRRGCETVGETNCSSVVTTISDTVVYRGSETIQTDVGKFNSLVYETTGSIETSLPNTLMDFRGACSNADAAFYAQTHIFPEVGVVYHDYTCTAQDGSGTGYNFQAYLSSTNVTIPN